MLQNRRIQSTDKQPSWWPSVWRGVAIGAVVGIAWTAVIGPLTAGPPPVWLSLVVYGTGFPLTGAIVGAVRRFPELVGLSAGFLTLAVLAFIVGPKDGWIVLWVLVFGGSGLLWGPVIGLLHRHFRPTMIGKPPAESLGVLQQTESRE